MFVWFCTHQSCSRLLSVSHRADLSATTLATNICEPLREDNALILASSPSAPCCSVEPPRCRKHGLCCVCKSNCANPLAPANVSFLRRGNRCNNGKKEWFFLKSYQSHSPTGANNHSAAREPRGASALPPRCLETGNLHLRESC